MYILALLIHITGAYPLWRALQANRHTTLYHTLWWAAAAWVNWGMLMVASATAGPGARLMLLRYLALALTGCAGVAVLGARRPIVAAWNLVLAGLLAVMLLPVAESVILKNESFDWVRVLFVIGTVLVIVLNYLPTCLMWAALSLAVGCGWEIQQMLRAENMEQSIQVSGGWFFLAVTPWVALWSWMRQAPPHSEFDRTWRAFRNRYGLVWGQRVREQFNRAADNAGWQVHLYWQGLLLKRGSHLPEPAVQKQMVETLRAILKRFGPREKKETK